MEGNFKMKNKNISISRQKNEYQVIDNFNSEDLIGIMNYAYYLLIKSGSEINFENIDVLSLNCKNLKNTF